jgi:hydroxymethylbilane synthase
MKKVLRIGTRDSQLAVWQASHVQQLLKEQNIESELVYIKSAGDIDLVTPLYEIGVQGVFTKTLDTALLSNKIDIAVHSMKDVPTQPAKGIVQAAVLKRGNYKDILVLNREPSVVSRELSDVSRELSDVSGELTIHDSQLTPHDSRLTIATSSLRRKAQWLHRFPNHKIENLRGNVNTRLKKVEKNNWHGAIFAAAGLERIHLRPKNSIELDWMLPAPAQGAIAIVCKENDVEAKNICALLNDENAAVCTKIERDFLRTLIGGCSTPIGALAKIEGNEIYFKGNIFSLDGKEKKEIELSADKNNCSNLGVTAAEKLLQQGADKIVETIRNARK